MIDTGFVRSFRSLGEMFRPPFNGLWLLGTLYFFWCYLVFPHSPVLRGEFPDTDDYMFLNQILDWLNGQGWYDNVQHRLDPPNGVPIHFSRLVMLPMAAMIKLVEWMGLGPKGAATVMATLYPVILLGIFFAVMRWVAESFMPKEWAGATAFVGMFATSTLNLFQPGHVDHHNLTIILIALSLGSAVRMMQRPDLHRWPLLVGLWLAYALVTALEVLPWVILLSAYIGFWAMTKAGNAARSGLLFSAAFFLMNVLGLLVTRPLSDVMTLDVLSYSAVYVILSAGVAFAFAGVYLSAAAPLYVRFVVGLIFAAVAGGSFLHAFPELRAGPYGGIDPALVRIILNEINEAQPLKLSDTSWMDIFWVTTSMVVAVPASLWFLAKSKGTERWGWGLMTVFLLTSMGVTFFYQRRFIGTMNMLEIVPLAVLLQRGWAWIGAHYRGRKQFFAELGLIFLVGPLTAVLLPAVEDNRSFNYGILTYPVSFSPGVMACETYELEKILRNPIGLGRKPLRIMNPMGIGPELLFRTNHTVLSAPYHMNVSGNVDSTRFFSTPYPEEAEAIARRRGIDLVVACIFVENFYLHTKPTDGYSESGGPGTDFAPHFVERLVQGHIPAWLKPVKTRGLSNYVIYEVLPPKSKDKTLAK